MPRLPELDPLVRRDKPLESVHSPAEEDERTGHTPRIVYLGELASDPAAADLPDDAVARIWAQGGKLKCALAGTVYELAPVGPSDDGDAIHDNEASEISAITEKVAPVDADLLIIEDSAAANVKKRVQVGSLPGGGDVATDAIWDALGDIVYGTGSNAGAKLAGQVAAVKKFLSQTGDGAASAAPIWAAILDADLPATIARDSELHVAVTVSGSPNYITLSGQDIVRALINLATHVTGTLPIANGGTGATTIRRVSKTYQFNYPAEDMAVGDFHSLTAMRAPESGEHGEIRLGKCYVRNRVIGTGTNTILVRTSTTLTGARTTRATIALGTSREAVSADLNFELTDGLYLWVECSAVGATAPKDVKCEIQATEEVF